MTGRAVPSTGAGRGTGPGETRRATVHRHPVDLVRVALGVAVVAVCFLLADRGELSVFERDVFRLVNHLPPVLYPVIWVPMQLGAFLAVPALAAAAALSRRFRLSRDLLISGLLAGETATLLKTAVRRERPAALVEDAVLHENTVLGIGFISGHSAIAAALATAAAPYLSRTERRVVWALAWSVAVGRIYVGAHLPLDVLGGLAAGWAVASLVHWLVGVPRRDPSPEWVADLLRRFGLPVREVRPTPQPARNFHPFQAVDGRGRQLRVKVLDPDRLDQDRLYRLWRLVVVRDVKDADATAPLGWQAEHEAVAAVVARDRGVRVPAVVLARGTHRGAAVVYEHLEGRGLDELPPGEVTPHLLDQVWTQVALLHDERVAHRDLVAAHVLVDRDRSPWIVDFGAARTGADDAELAEDVAELMTSLALRLDPRSVVDSAVDVLGPDAAAAALPGLTPMARSSDTRAGVRADRSRLRAVRQALRERVGLPDPDVSAFGTAGPAAYGAVGLAAVVTLLGLPLIVGGGDVVESVRSDGWRWLGAALVLAVLGRAAKAGGLLLAVDRRLALGRALGAQMVAEGAGLLHGVVGWHRAAARFLERAGATPRSAQRTIDRYAAGGVVAAAVVTVGSLALAAANGDLAPAQTPTPLLPTLLLGLAAWALTLLAQWLARRHAADRKEDRSEGRARPMGVLVRAWHRRPERPGPVSWRRGAQLAWMALGVGLEAVALAAAVHAVGGDTRPLALAGAYAGLHLVWWVLPVVGAAGMADVSLLLALSTLGLPLVQACAAALAFRLFTYWLPAVLGVVLVSRRFEALFPA